jgi:integrase
VDGAAEVKDGGGHLRQSLLPWVWRRVAHLVPAGGGHVIEGTETERREGVFRRVSAWMRGLGWEAHKTAHGLRDLAISAVIAESGSPYEGQKFARHASVAVTEAHYGHFAGERWMAELVAEMKRPGG